MKAAPAIAALERKVFRQVLVHTGQHYDAALSGVFFQHLGKTELDCALCRAPVVTPCRPLTQWKLSHDQECLTRRQLIIW